MSISVFGTESSTKIYDVLSTNSIVAEREECDAEDGMLALSSKINPYKCIKKSLRTQPFDQAQPNATKKSEDVALSDEPVKSCPAERQIIKYDYVTNKSKLVCISIENFRANEQWNYASKAKAEEERKESMRQYMQRQEDERHQNQQDHEYRNAISNYQNAVHSNLPKGEIERKYQEVVNTTPDSLKYGANKPPYYK